MAISDAGATTGTTPARLGVTGLRTASVAEYARGRDDRAVHLERRGGRTYLVAG